MPSLNKVQLIGNVTRDPEVKFTQSGTAVCEIILAINRKYKNQSGETVDEVTYVSVTFWTKIAELIGKYARKGSAIYTEGRLTQDSWEDKQTGKKQTKTKIVGESVQFLDGKKSGDSAPRSVPARQQETDEDSEPPF